jgi:hypothetical protein
MSSKVSEVQQVYDENIKDCLYIFGPVMAIIRRCSQCHKEVLHMYDIMTIDGHKGISTIVI